ncbi:MAG TPA: DNA internalization-related competence protein ComEC/Rec2 [Thermoanaerobaculia bacterium]|nr:DNA internalization-related competence protein ComEC/Rec2 [Thermoanaerobaculia bacterium]
MALRWPPAVLPVGAFLAGAALAPQLAYAPALVLPLALAVLGGVLGGQPGLSLATFSLGLLRAEASWVARMRASPGWDLDRPVEALFAPDEPWEPRDGSWTASGRIRALSQDGRREEVDLRARAVVSSAQAPPEAGSYRLRGYLRPPLAFLNGDPAIRTGGWRLRVKSARWVAAAGPPRASGAVDRARARLLASLGVGARPGGGNGSALLEGLLLGRTAALPEDWQRGLRRTGLSHLFAVSGLHVGLIAGVVWAATALLRPAARGACALAVAGAYALLVGLGPTVLRSLFMLTAMILARLSRRSPSAINALALSAGLLAAGTPVLVYDLSFQLTVAATAGVVGLGPFLARRWGGGPLATSLAVGAGAQLATLPFTVPAFSLVPLGGAALNLIGVPWTGLCLVLGLLWAVVALVEPSWGMALVALFEPLARPYGWLAALPAHPMVSVPIALGTGTACAVAALALGLAARPRRLAVAASIVAAVVLLFPGFRAQDFEVVVLDVGQGDAILLRDGRRALLVDGGGWPAGDFGGRVLLPALARLGVRALDAVVVSHPDSDHCAGLADIAAYLPIGEVWIAPGWGGAPCLDRLLGRAGARLRVVWRGDAVEWGRFRFAVLHPSPGEEGAGNDRSLVLEASAGGRSLLLTGDISDHIETRLVRRRVLRPVDLLKIAHHGSRSSTSLPFLASAAPRWAVVSAGRGNAYGHPSDSVVRKLERRGIPVLRTDRHGWIRLRWRPAGPLRIVTGRTPGLVGESTQRMRLGPARLALESLGAP